MAASSCAVSARSASPGDIADRTAGVEARNQIVMANIRLVYLVARNHPGISRESLEDCIQWGVLGLIRAAEKYDPQKGSFSRYAILWIRQAMDRGLAQTRDRRLSRYAVEWLKTWYDVITVPDAPTDAATLAEKLVERRQAARGEKIPRLSSATVRMIHGALRSSASLDVCDAERVNAQSSPLSLPQEQRAVIRWVRALAEEHRKVIRSVYGVSFDAPAGGRHTPPVTKRQRANALHALRLQAALDGEGTASAPRSPIPLAPGVIVMSFPYLDGIANQPRATARKATSRRTRRLLPPVSADAALPAPESRDLALSFARPPSAPPPIPGFVESGGVLSEANHGKHRPA